MSSNERITPSVSVPSPPTGPISVETAHTLLAAGALFVDVRDESEYEEDGGIIDAVNIPLPTIGKGGEKRLPPDRQIVLYCKMGPRSAKARGTLSSLGFNCYSLEGGISAWKKSPITAGS